MTLAPQAVGSLAAILVILLATCIYQWWQNKTYKINSSSLRAIKADFAAEADKFFATQEGVEALRKQQNELEHNIEKMNEEYYVAREKAVSAGEVAEKELQLQKMKRVKKYTEELDEEFQRLRDSHQLTKTQEELGNLTAQISEARRTLTALQKQAINDAEKEDFYQAHSLEITPPEQADITLLREFGPRIARRDAVNKLIWTEYYQRPLQNLRKSLEADKKTGIYMIEEQGTGKMYIGQAVNIGERWAEHVKTALGIGSTSYQTNKFYRAMHDKGPEAFAFSIVELCDAKSLNDRERHWIDFYNATSFGYNTKIGG